MKRSKQRGIKLSQFVRLDVVEGGLVLSVFTGAKTYHVDFTDPQMRKLKVWLTRYFEDK